MSQDYKKLIQELAGKDPVLYDALMGIVEIVEEKSALLDDLIKKLTLPNVAYGHSHVPKLVRLRRLTNQSSGAGGGLTISFTSASVYFDNYIHWISTVPTRLTFRMPCRALCGFCIRIESPGGPAMIPASILLNGVTEIVSDIDITPGGLGDDIILGNSTLYEFKKDDYIELIVTNFTGGVLTATHHAEYAPVLWAVSQERLRDKSPITENFVPGDF